MPSASHLPLGSVNASAAIVSPDAMPGEELGLLVVGAGVHDGVGREHDGREVGGAQQHAAHLLEHDAELDEGEALPAVLLGDVEALEAELVGHLAPHRGVVALGGLHQPADLGRRRLRLEESTHGVAQLLLLVGEGEVHGWAPGCPGIGGANATGPASRRARPPAGAGTPARSGGRAGYPGIHAASRPLRDPDGAHREADRRPVREQRVRRARARAPATRSSSTPPTSTSSCSR